MNICNVHIGNGGERGSRTGAFEISDVGDFLGGVASGAFDFVTDPKNWIRAVSLMGWPAFLASALPGLLAPAASAVLFASPGLITGDPVSDAFLGEFAWRMKAYSLYLTASGIYDAARAAAETVKTIPDQFHRATTDGTDAAVLEQRVRDTKYMYPDLTPAQILAKVNLDPEKLLQRLMAACAARGEACREDVQALVANYVAHAPIFNTKDFDIATGKRIDDPTRLRAWRKYLLDQATAAVAAKALADRLAAEQYAKEHGYKLAPRGIPYSVNSPEYIQLRISEEKAKGSPSYEIDRLQKNYDDAIDREAADQAAAEEAARAMVTPPISASPVRSSTPILSRSTHVLAQLLRGSLITAPAWGTLLAILWWKKRQDARRRAPVARLRSARQRT